MQDAEGRATEYLGTKWSLKDSITISNVREEGRRKAFIYFDNATSGHKPQVVLNVLQQFYSTEYGKPKDEHILSKEVTQRMQEARKKVTGFVGASYRTIRLSPRGLPARDHNTANEVDALVKA